MKVIDQCGAIEVWDLQESESKKLIKKKVKIFWKKVTNILEESESH